MTAVHISEDELLQGLLDAAYVGGWLVHHIRRSDQGIQQGHGGFPDLILVHPSRRKLLVIECKAATGRLAPLQAEWLDAFRQCGVDARTIYPADYDQTWRELVGDRLKAATWRSHPENDE